ncbi:hypothetical protein DFH06DRAFT_1215877 [Mycena polygramma]|nr:hypothetical protein DFH06DRAFT_1215877 [Mycena polygramma]
MLTHHCGSLIPRRLEGSCASPVQAIYSKDVRQAPLFAMRSTSFSLALAAGLSNALVNITVDDTDTPSISFTSQSCLTLQPGNSWEVSPGKFLHPSSCHNQTLRRCDEEGASVSFTFTGVAVYVVYPPWPHEMSVTATLDSNSPTFLTIPAGSGESSADTGVSAPVWGVSGLPNTEHTLTISRPGGPVYVDAFMYTTLCDTPLCPRRRGGTEPSDDNFETTPIPGAPSGAASSSAASPSVAGSSSAVSSASAFSSASAPSSSTSAVSSTSSVPVSSAPTTSLLPTTPSRIASSHVDTVKIALGVLLGVLFVSLVLAFLIFRRYRRRRLNDAQSHKETPAPPYTASSESESELIRPPSMRERNDRFSDTHTPAGTPLTRSPGGASFLTSLSSNSMGLKQLPLSEGVHEKGAHPPSSLGTSMQDNISEVPLDVPPPEYETQL